MGIERDKGVSSHKGGHVCEMVDRVEAQSKTSCCFDLVQLAILPNLHYTKGLPLFEEGSSKILLCIQIQCQCLQD